MKKEWKDPILTVISTELTENGTVVNTKVDRDLKRGEIPTYES